MTDIYTGSYLDSYGAGGGTVPPSPPTRVTVDFDRLMYGLLAPRLVPHGVKVVRRTDVDVYDDLPLLRISSGNGVRIGNGAYQLAQQWTLYATLLRYRGDEDSYDLDDLCFQQIHLLHDEGAFLAGVGQVTSVDEEAMFAVTNEATLNEKVIEQLDATFSVIVRPY